MLEPFEWNVVVTGAWNLALLTPSWLQRSVFKDPTAAVELFLPVDFAGPPRVRLGKIAIIVQTGALVVDALDCTYETLARAQELASSALEALSQTPITAVGINVRFRLGDVPARTLTLTATKLDEELPKGGYVLQSKAMQRTLSFEAGVLNLAITEDDRVQGTAVFNFHLGTNDNATAREWLSLATGKLETAVDGLLQCIGIEKGSAYAN